MSDTGEGQLSNAERRILKAARGASEDQQVIFIRTEGSKNGDSFAKLKDSLLIAGILAMAGITWNMSINVARLETTVATLAVEVKDLQARIKP